MASIVLGKRNRGSTTDKSADDALDRVVSSRRSKRPTRSSLAVNDENEDPLGHDDDDDDDGSLEGSTPTKHVVGDRIVLSPTKANARRYTTTTSDIIQTPTPRTPRHRDAFSKPGRGGGTGPVTPKHRVTVVGKPLTPRAFRTPSSSSIRTPTTGDGGLSTIYHTARQLFVRSAHPPRLVGRDDERAQLKCFLQQRVDAKTGGCLYVSGPPGTGKSALVHEVCAELEEEASLSTTTRTTRRAYVNCMSVHHARDLLGKLVEDLNLDVDAEDESKLDPAKTVLQKTFINRKRKRTSYVVVLDEMDHLLTLGLELVYALFEWSLQRTSQLVLIGIANALDLTDRFLPRLKAKNLTPQLLSFLPYAAPQINSIITSKLRSLLLPRLPEADGSSGSVVDVDVDADFVPFIHPSAIQLCAKKVASQTGDIRKAFDICRRAIDLIETETKREYLKSHQSSPPMTPSDEDVLMENINLSSSSSSSSSASPGQRMVVGRSSIDRLRSLTARTAARATIAHVARIAAASFGNNTNQRVRSLNLQQKAALCTLVALEKMRRQHQQKGLKNKGQQSTPSKMTLDPPCPTVQIVFETYRSLCQRDDITLHPLTRIEFRDVIDSLESLSLLNTIDGRHYQQQQQQQYQQQQSSRSTTPSSSKRSLAYPCRRRLFTPSTSSSSTSSLRSSMSVMTKKMDGRGDDRRLGSCVDENDLMEAVDGLARDILSRILLLLLLDNDDDDGQRRRL